MAARTTSSGTPRRASKKRPCRIGKVREGTTGRGWQAKLYGPTASFSGSRVAFRNTATAQWVYRTVPEPPPLSRSPSEGGHDVNDGEAECVESSTVVHGGVQRGLPVEFALRR